MQPTLRPAEAWQPLPPDEWRAATAAHLLRRAGWTARPGDVDRAVTEGMKATVDRLFPTGVARFPAPPLIAKLAQDAPEIARRLKSAAPAELHRIQREGRERSQVALQDMSIRWLRYAAAPETAAAAKWVLFLSDVYVVGADKVKNSALIWQHFDLLGQYATSTGPNLAKAMSRSPAMITYLDLNQSRRGAPNENFARELFELFVLGEGNYSEKDIKEAARAFTGYRQEAGAFRFAKYQHDRGAKTIFGQTGRWDGDDVVDIAFRQPAASRFLPQELARFYLTDRPLPSGWLEALGDDWRQSGFHLRTLAHRFFSSRAFYAPEFRAGYIKSPIQFYLGLVTDLELDVPPLFRQTIVPLRRMGQTPFTPPNVRGWVGGRNWINSATYAQRRQLVESLFNPIREEALNADERQELAAARGEGATTFSVPDAELAPYAKLEPAAATDRLLANFLALPVAPEFREGVRQFLATDRTDESQQMRRLRRAFVALLQSPEYQLC